MGGENTLLARGRRPAEEWLTAVRKQAAPGNESYRSATLPEDRLWSVVEDPGADPTARVGAAVALRAQLRVAGVEKRIRIAAGTTALPEVREAFAEIADEPDDDRDHLLELHEILERMEDADDHPPIDDDVYRKQRFDLCPECYRKFVKNPLGRELASPLGFSKN